MAQGKIMSRVFVKQGRIFAHFFHFKENAYPTRVSIRQKDNIARIKKY